MTRTLSYYRVALICLGVLLLISATVLLGRQWTAAAAIYNFVFVDTTRTFVEEKPEILVCLASSVHQVWTCFLTHRTTPDGAVPPPKMNQNIRTGRFQTFY